MTENKGDLISRSELKKALTSNCKPELCHDYNTSWCEKCCRTHDFEDLIDEAPAVDLWQLRQEATENALKKAEVLHGRMLGEWVPVSERLPEGNIDPMTNDLELVLCSTLWGAVRTYKYGKPIGHDKAHFWDFGGIMDDYVVAWQPLPEPYKEGGKI